MRAIRAPTFHPEDGPSRRLLSRVGGPGPRRRRRGRGLFAALLLLSALLFPVAGAEAQSGLPGDDRHGKEGTWDLGPKKPPMEDEDDDRFTFDRKKMRVIDCHLREVQELGRIYVQEVAGGAPYWIQLPDAVKIRAVRKSDFDGRKRLKLEDLEAGQRLELRLRKKDDEILMVRVRPS